MKLLKYRHQLQFTILGVFIVLGAVCFLIFIKKLPNGILHKQPTTVHSPVFETLGGSSSSSIPAKQNTVIWGKVNTKDGKPLAGVIVYIGQSGAKTNDKGEYVLSIQEEGTLMVTFIKKDSDERYYIADSFEPVMYITKGQNEHRDFIVEKVAKQP